MPSTFPQQQAPRPGVLHRHPAVFLPWFLSAALLVSCGGTEEKVAYRVVERLVPEVPELFSPDEIATFETVLDDDFARPETAGLWQRRGFDLADRADPSGEWVLGASGKGELERLVELDASRVDRLEVLMLGLDEEKLELSWAGPGQDFDDGRRLATTARRHLEPPSFRFNLSHHAAWNGPVARLRLRFEPGARRRARLVRIWAVDRKVETERVNHGFARAWKIRFRSDTRSGRLVSRGRPMEHRLEVSPGAVLEGAFGLHRQHGSEVPFGIELVDASGVVQEVFAARVGRDALAPNTWHPARVELAPWSGRQVTLRFRADVTESALAAWGELAIVAPSSGAEVVESQTSVLPDVVLVVVDTLRADRLSLYGYEHATSPHLDAWARNQGVVFRSAVSPAPWTYPSHVSLFTGLDTLSHGYHDAVALPASTEMLAEVLQGVGYETLAVTAGGYVSPRYGFAQGFDRYFTNTRGDRVAEGDLPFNLEKSLEWLGEGDRPAFLFLHTFEVHSPYHVRQPYYRELFGDEGDPDLIGELSHQRQGHGTTAGAVIRRTLARGKGQGAPPIESEDFPLVSRAYDSGVAYADHLLGDFFTALEERGRPTLLILTSDHGEALGEHGGLGEHGYLYDHNLMVPLILSLPGGRGAGAMIDRQVRTIDIFPTVLDALGLEPRPGIDGRSLLPLLDDGRVDFPRVAWSSTAMQGVALRQDGKVKYIANPTVWERERAAESFFRLDRDPLEIENLAASEATESFRRATIDRYHRTLKGLLLVVDQPSASVSGVERLLITAPKSQLGAPQVRSFDAPPGALPVPRPGLIEVRTPPGGRFSVALERLGPRSPLRLALEGEASCTVELAELVGEDDVAPSPIRLGSDCRPLAEAAEGVFTLTLLFSGTEATGAEAPELSPELERQLEALGYLD